MPQDVPAKGLGPYRNHFNIGVPVGALVIKRFACPRDPNLYPTHPSQGTKEYHLYDTAQYSNQQLDGRDDTCLVSQVRAHPRARPLNPATVQRIIREAEANGRRIACLQADIAHRVVLSDTYIDACGNYYRGVKRTSFLQSNESMGTLFSPGRTNYDRGNSVSDGQYDGDTYPVRHTEFAFLAELLPGDMPKITQARAAARATHTLDTAGRIFHLK
jgi:hypothetical protein